MGKSVFAVFRRTVSKLKGMLIPGVAVLLALIPAAAVNMATPVSVCAAIELRGDVTTGTTTNDSLAIDKPTGVVTGDVMIVNIAGVGSNDTTPNSDGWILINGADLGGAPPRYGAVLYRVADGTEEASFTFTLGGGTTSAVGSIVAFSGVDTSGTDPFDAVPGAISVPGYQTTSVEATAIATASPNAAVIMFGMAANSAPTWSGWATGLAGALTELYDSQASSSGKASVGAAWATKATAGNTGDGAATLSSAERNGGILIALKPLKPTTLTVAPVTGTYGGTASLTATLSPPVSGKTISFTLNGTAAGTAVTDSTGAASIPAASLSGITCGTYSDGVGASFEAADSFSGSSGTASLTVRPRDITVTADEKSKVYGDTDPALTYKITSGFLVGGDAFYGSPVRAAGEDAGVYAIRRGTLSLSANYNLTFVESTFTINVRNIVVKADDSGKAYGDDDPALTYQITSGSLAANDAFSGKLARETGEDLGTYAIRQGTLALTKNYNFTFVEGIFTISLEGPPAPTVSGISPQSARPGDTLDVVITGSNFAGATDVRFGPGVTVNSFAVESPTRIVANITIDPAAGAADNTIVVTTPLGEGQLPGAFSVDLSEEADEVSGSRLLQVLIVLLAIVPVILLFWWFRREKKRADPQLEPILAPSRPPGGTREAAEAQAAVLDQPLVEATAAANTDPAPAVTAGQPLEATEETADLEQASAVAAVAANESLQEAGKPVEPEEMPPAAGMSQPLEETENVADLAEAPAMTAGQLPEAMPEAADLAVAPVAAVAASQPSDQTDQAPAIIADHAPEVTPEAVEPEQAPASVAGEPPKETEKTADVPQAAAAGAAAAAAPKPRRRTTKKALSVEQAPTAAEQPRRRTTKKAPASTSSRPRTSTKKRKKSTG